MISSFDISTLLLILALSTVIALGCTLVLILAIATWPERLPGILKRFIYKNVHVPEKSQGVTPDILDAMNHELRTPLAGMLASAQILHEEVAPRHRELTDMLVHSTKRMDKALHQYLEMVALEQNYTWKPKPVHVASEIDPVLKLHHEAAASKGIVIYANDIDTQLIANLDPELFRNIVHHLVDNAIQATQDGIVSIAVKHEGRWLRVEIKDAGVPLRKALLPGHFSSFRPDPANSPQDEERQALDLELTRRMIDLAGGSLELNHSDSQGASFVATFPQGD